mmetsp:Transcript_53619/g.105754  ORF Transcript_53619/g.105754 Transcript_53619/m.105754 type:complete len:289 (-) Transcript_53619:717-1583(-)
MGVVLNLVNSFLFPYMPKVAKKSSELGVAEPFLLLLLLFPPLFRLEELLVLRTAGGGTEVELGCCTLRPTWACREECVRSCAAMPGLPAYPLLTAVVCLRVDGEESSRSARLSQEPLLLSPEGRCSCPLLLFWLIERLELLLLLFLPLLAPSAIPVPTPAAGAGAVQPCGRGNLASSSSSGLVMMLTRSDVTSVACFHNPTAPVVIAAQGSAASCPPLRVLEDPPPCWLLLLLEALLLLLLAVASCTSCCVVLLMVSAQLDTKLKALAPISLISVPPPRPDPPVAPGL